VLHRLGLRRSPKLTARATESEPPAA